MIDARRSADRRAPITTVIAPSKGGRRSSAMRPTSRTAFGTGWLVLGLPAGCPQGIGDREPLEGTGLGACSSVYTRNGTDTCGLPSVSARYEQPTETLKRRGWCAVRKPGAELPDCSVSWRWINDVLSLGS